MSSPFPPHITAAVRACTRTLAASADADAPLARAEAATLGGLRAVGDRLAVRQRFHSQAIHQRHQPAERPESDIYDALELARLDALGVSWLPGVAHNLMAHPGADDDGVRWLVFEALGDRPAPPGKAARAAQIRAALPPVLADALGLLTAERENQERFAAHAAEWARAIRAALPASLIGPAKGPRMSVPMRQVETSAQRAGDDPRAASSRPGEKTRDERGSEDAGTAGQGAGGSPGPAEARVGYRVYTRAYDRIENAATLVDRDELAELRVKLEAEFSAIRSLVARLSKRLQRVLMARQVRHWDFDLDEGLLDGSRLAALVANGRGTRPFKQESESPFPSTVVSLLIDHSGSMRGRPMLIAALTVEIFARVLERCGVQCEVLGFTTRDWDGGEPARAWAANGYPEHPGRLNALEHIVIKGADVPWRRARVALGLFLHDDLLKENIDGEAVRWAHDRLLARAERRRILIVVSDGTPMDEATLAANGHEYLEQHLLAVVDDIEARSAIRLAAIGIGHNVSPFYRNAMTIARIEHLGPALTFTLTSLLGGDGRASSSRRVRRARRRS